MRILFVEDNARFAKLAMAQFLSKHDVVLVESIAQALETLQIQTYDVVLIDFDLRDGKGPIVARTASELVPKPWFSNIISVLETRFGASGPF